MVVVYRKNNMERESLEKIFVDSVGIYRKQISASCKYFKLLCLCSYVLMQTLKIQRHNFSIKFECISGIKHNKTNMCMYIPKNNKYLFNKVSMLKVVWMPLISPYTHLAVRIRL